MKFAREAWPFVAPFAVLALILVALGRPRWAAAALVVGFLVLLFFRDPRRSPPADPALILAPADGKVTKVDVLEDPLVGPGRFQRVVTFLSVFDVHVQKVPTPGRVLYSARTPGAKVAAFRDDADRVNEFHLSVIERPDGSRLGVRQIAGLLARRVVCHLQAGQTVERGQSLGVIKFGSRVDLLVPADWEILVQPGDRLKNGETPVARPPQPRAGQ